MASCQAAPLNTVMVNRLSAWNDGTKGLTYRFFDKACSSFFSAGGTAVFVHLYLGPYQQDSPMINRDGSTVPAYDPAHPTTGNVSTIEDVLFLENRDRKYSKVVYELRGVYNVADMDFSLLQFGLFLQNDTVFIEFHLNDMISRLGRRLMSGDVIELPHRRDDTLDQNAPAINKFYVIEDASRSASGYGPNWWPYVWRVKCSPMTASQEFNDILQQQQTNPYGWTDPGTIGSLMSTMAFNMNIDEAVVEAAKIEVPKRYFETQQFWMTIPEADSTSYPWVFAGDGIPPNGAVPLGAGRVFPLYAKQGDYFLRLDYRPATLFMWDANAWRMQEQDWRGDDWSAMHRLLSEFVQSEAISTFNDSTTGPERQALSKAIKPRADF